MQKIMLDVRTRENVENAKAEKDIKIKMFPLHCNMYKDIFVRDFCTRFLYEISQSFQCCFWEETGHFLNTVKMFLSLHSVSGCYPDIESGTHVLINQENRVK